MMQTLTRSGLFLTLAVLCVADTPKPRPDGWAQPVPASSLENLYRVSDEVYRSEQPKPSDIRELKALGIQTVLSLRHYHSDSPEFERAGITSLQYEMDAGSVTIPDLIAILRLMRTARKPVLVHCWHGSDRTGFVIAGYRMVFQNWSATEATKELREGGFGYHAKTYPNIAKILLAMDVPAVRKAVFDPVAPSAGAAPHSTAPRH